MFSSYRCLPFISCTFFTPKTEQGIIVITITIMILLFLATTTTIIMIIIAYHRVATGFTFPRWELPWELPWAINPRAKCRSSRKKPSRQRYEPL